MPGWHRKDEAHRVYCGRCRRPITMCRGIDNDWMHEDDRSERCADGHLCAPETPEQVDRRHSGKGLVL